jgi:2-methoxy-6-polyprenyl-1,4-benzoquinol methylase
VFSSVASSYDIMNDVMSAGIHRLWKDHYVSKMNPHGGMQILDVAGGTGDIAIRMLDHARTKYADRDTKVTILDINPEMLEEGKKRMAQTMYHGGEFARRHSFARPRPPPRRTTPGNPGRMRWHSRACTHRPVADSTTFGNAGSQVDFILGNAESLTEIPDNSIDLYTIAFGIRNCTHVDRVLAEAFRVLKPGGVFSCLEFSKVTNPILAK